MVSYYVHSVLYRISRVNADIEGEIDRVRIACAFSFGQTMK